MLGTKNFKILVEQIGRETLNNLIYNYPRILDIIPALPLPSQAYYNKKISDSISEIFKGFKPRGLVPGSEEKETVLFMEPRGGTYIRFIMGVIAKRLEYEGHKVCFVNCEDLPICNNSSIIAPAPENYCKDCLLHSKDILEAFNIDSYSLNELIDPNVRIAANELCSNLGIDEIKQFVYHGYPLGEYINISVCSYLFRGSPINDENSVRIMRSFLKGLIILFHSYESIINRFGPTRILMSNGRFFWYKLAYEMCKVRALPIITMDDFGSTGGTGDRWMFSHDRPIAELELDSYWEEWKNIALTVDEREHLNRDFIEKSVTNKIYYSDPQKDWHDIALSLNIDQESSYDVMFTNLTWDSTAIDRDEHFDNMFDWIFTTIDIYISSKRPLLIRIHPAEKGIFGLPSFHKVGDEIKKKYGDLPENIKIIPPESQISSYSLLNKSSIAIVYSSTLGLEAALRGMNVLVAGRVHYAKKGFTTEVPSRQEYHSWITGIKSFNRILSPEQIEMAYRYAYFYLYRTKIPLEFYEAKQFKVTKLKLKSFKEIMPGVNPNLDLVINGIINNVPICLSRNLSNKLYKLQENGSN